MNARIPVILILGQGHSGSTLMDAMLDSHSAIVGVGEVFRYHRAIERNEDCSCGRKVSVCPFWMQVFAHLDSHGSKLVHRSTLDWFLDRAHFVHVADGVLSGVDTHTYLDFNYALFSELLRVSGKRILCDSSKSVDRAALLLSDPRFDVTLVHLVRDGRATAYSYKRKTGVSIYRFMREWAMTNLKVESLHRRYPHARYIPVRFDDFVADPSAVLARILSSFSLAPESAMLSYKDKEHHRIGGNIRFRARKDSIVAQDTGWRSHISFIERLWFALFFGWMNWKYGYPLLRLTQKVERDETVNDVRDDE